MKTVKRRNKTKPALVKENLRGLVPSVHYGELDVEYNAYLEEINPNGESRQSNDVRRALATSTDIRFKEFLGRLSDPKFKGRALATIAKSCDISLPEFAQWWQSAQKARLIARAQEGLVKITEDIIRDATSKLEPCSVCDGYGWRYADPDIPSDMVPGGTREMGDRQIRTCLQCGGRGTVQTIGNIDSRKLLLDMTGLSSKKGGMNVTVSTTFGGVGVESAVERMSQMDFAVDVDFENLGDKKDE